MSKRERVRILPEPGRGGKLCGFSRLVILVSGIDYWRYEGLVYMR
jgi:hypothetical protein